MLDGAQSPHRLVEFLTAVSGHDDAAGARAAAAMLAAEEFDAEIGALVACGSVLAAFGFGTEPVPTEALLALDRGARVADIPGVGTCHVATALWEASERGLLIVARTAEEFAPEERNLLLGMARGVGLTLRMIGALEAEHERGCLLEVLLDIQRAISHRAPVSEVLAAVTEGATSLLGGRRVSLVLHDGPNGAAPASGAGLVAPVHVGGARAGALVADAGPGEISDSGRGLLAAFAQHASLALTDARLVEAVEEAYRDAVTGLPNRTLFLERLTTALEGDRSRIAVLFVDLDRFKAVNDSLGHAAGDELLRTVADRISACIRPRDTAARFGGDEFAVLLEDVEVEVAETVAERIIKKLRGAVSLGDGNVFIGATVGIAFAGEGGGDGEGEGEDAETLLRNADLAMYRAKNAGGSRAATFTPSMHVEVVERVALEVDLQAALAAGQLILHYQPIVNLASGQPVAVEALVRWRHPRRGLLFPAEFIPVAEETGAILAIGGWVLRHATARLAKWRSTVPALALSVNVSARQLRDERFASEVEQVLATAGLPGTALTLEITESLFVRDDGDIPALARLERLGVSIAIDDFGTGYSSLRNLNRLPVNILKVDRSFVDALTRTPQDRAITATIIALGRTMNLDNVAEGIETADQLEALREMGCEFGQGFHLARPMEAAGVTEYLAQAARSEVAVADNRQRS